MSIFLEITLLLLVVLAVSVAMRLLRQPLVVGYILAGILIGPVGINLITSHEMLDLFSHFGIAILLFIVGMHLTPQILEEVGLNSLIVGLLQVLLTSVFAFGISLLLGLSVISAVYVALALSFSSTIIILKLLSDRGQTQSIFGKMSIGILIVQDVVAAFILIILPSFANPSLGVIPTTSLLILKLIGVFLGLYACMTWVLPRISGFLGKSQELLFIFALTWGLGIAAFFEWLGLSMEIGALFAGVALSTLPFAEEVSSRLRPLRDFFIIIFFISLGASMTFNGFSQLLVPVIVLTGFVLLIKPLIIILLMNLRGYHQRTSFFTGVTLAQISEFSLILAAIGYALGHLSAETLTIITLVGLTTIAGSTYLISFSEHIYPKLSKYLQYLEPPHRKSPKNHRHHKIDVLLFGCERSGHEFYKLAEKLGHQIGVVDLNPEKEQALENTDIDYFFGDASNLEFLQELPFDSSKLVVSSIPSLETNLLLVKHIRKHRPRALIVVLADNQTEAEKLYDAGATSVVLPHEHAAKYIVRRVFRRGLNKATFV